MKMANQDDNAHNEYRTLFIMCKYCFYISILIIPASIVVFFKWPLYPENILDILAKDKFTGLMSLDFVYSLGSLTSIPIFLLYYISTQKVNKSLSLLSLVLGLMSLVSLFTSRPILELSMLSDLYGKAASESERSQLKEIGSTLLLYFRGTTYNIHSILGNVSLLITSFLMFRNKYYSKAIAYSGLITTILAFTAYIPVFGLYLATFSVIGYIVWWVLTILKFRKILNVKNLTIAST